MNEVKMLVSPIMNIASKLARQQVVNTTLIPHMVNQGCMNTIQSIYNTTYTAVSCDTLPPYLLHRLLLKLAA